MAKKQTFADKSKAKDKEAGMSVKTIVSVYDEETKSWKFRERMLRVASLNDLQNMKF